MKIKRGGNTTYDVIKFSFAPIAENDRFYLFVVFSPKKYMRLLKQIQSVNLDK